MLLACGGCDMLFQLDRVKQADADTAPPDVMVDARPPPCAPSLDITFDNTDVCAPWGDVIANHTVVTQGGGKLTVQPSIQAEAFGGCSAKGITPLTPDGIIVEVEKVLGTGYTVLNLGNGTDLQIMAAGDRLRMSSTDGMMIWSDMPEPLYSPSAMRWWRLRRYSPSDVIAEYSADAMTWKRLGVHANMSAAVAPFLTAGGSADGLDTAVFRRLIMCN